ncbi:MAG: hypothetical protein AB7U59_15540 [Desulfovibrionaceae bacterium]
MGRFLQVRVTVTTWDRDLASEAFPRLYALAWPVEPTPPAGPQGLLELIQALDDRIRLGEVPGVDRKALLPALGRAVAAKGALEAALADRDAHAADKLTYAVEDVLGELEKIAPKP